MNYTTQKRGKYYVSFACPSYVNEIDCISIKQLNENIKCLWFHSLKPMAPKSVDPFE